MQSEEMLDSQGVVEKSPRSAEFLLPQSDFTTAVIPAKAGIHFDFSPGGAAATLLLCDDRMRNPENSPFVFVFDSASPHPEVKTSERGGEKAKAKMDSGFRRNDGGRVCGFRRGGPVCPPNRSEENIENGSTHRCSPTPNHSIGLYNPSRGEWFSSLSLVGDAAQGQCPPE